MDRRPAFAVAALMLGSLASGLATFSTWARFGPLALGDVHAVFRRYSGWELGEGVAIWTLAIGATLVAISLGVDLRRKWRLPVALTGALLGIATLGIGLRVSVSLEARIAQEEATFYGYGGNTGIEFNESEVEVRGGYLMTFVGGGLILVGAAIATTDAIRQRGTGDA